MSYANESRTWITQVSDARSAAGGHAERRQHRRALVARFDVDRVVQARAVAVHGDTQRPEIANPKAPEALRIQVVEIDVLDRFDPGRLQRCGAADDSQISASQLAERGERSRTHAALADDEAHSILRHPRPRK